MEPQQLIEKLEKRPETYNTILGKNLNLTEKHKLERKLRWYLRHGHIMRGKIIKHNNTIFYSPKKKYHIFMFEKQQKVRIIYSNEAEVINSKKIYFQKCHELKNSKWVCLKNQTFKSEELRKWI